MRPASEAELAEMISAANGPLQIKGGGTRGIGGDGIALETSALKGITLYEPGALTLVAQAGTPVADIEAMLAAENQRLAFEPTDLRDALGTTGTSTIGGVVATGASGPRRIAVGAVRDHMLGVRFVDGAGNVVKNGGRVMKNVTGYDLVKLMSGAHGTLGVLTEVSLKVLPMPQMQASLRISKLSPEQSVAAMSSALASPFEVSGAARTADGDVLLRLEGFEASVTYRAEELTKKLAKYGQILFDENCANDWTGIRDARAFANSSGDLWRISVKPSDAPAALDAIKPTKSVMDWGGGLIWAEVGAGTNLRANLTVPGHATLIRTSADTAAKLGRFQPEAPVLAKVSQGLRARFDPKGILNPGLMEAAQ